MSTEREERDDAELPSEQLRERQMVLRTLVKHPGWQLVVRCAERQQLQYQRRALLPLSKLDEAIETEYAKGIAQGITEVLTTPEQMLEALEAELLNRSRTSEAAGDDGDDDEGADNG